jgi:hypothetical protein
VKTDILELKSGKGGKGGKRGKLVSKRVFSWFFGHLPYPPVNVWSIFSITTLRRMVFDKIFAFVIKLVTTLITTISDLVNRLVVNMPTIFPVFAIVFLIVSVLVIEVVGCKWDNLLPETLFTPGIRVIG